jgi:hypothetical protein
MTEAKSDADAGAASGGQRVTFHYIKSKDFRVVHADGAIGGPTARGYLQCTFYSERGAIPQTITFEVANNKLEEVSRETKRDAVRELEVSILMDEQTVIELIDWLTRKLDVLRKAKQS